MRRILGVAVALALFGAAGAFAVDLSIGADIPLGMTYWNHPDLDESINGFLYGGEVVLNAMFTPQFAGEFKIGLVFDSWTDDVAEWDYRDRYFNLVGLFKFYVNPTVFVGAGLEYSRFATSHIEDSFGNEVDVDRSDLEDAGVDEDIDPLFILAAAGVDLVVSPTLIVPLAVNVAYGILNIPDDVTRMHIYGTIGIRYLL